MLKLTKHFTHLPLLKKPVFSLLFIIPLSQEAMITAISSFLKSKTFGLALLLLLLATFTACEDASKKYKNLIPKASGSRSEIVLLMDAGKWKGDLGLQVREVLMDPLQGVIHNEPRFKLIKVDPTSGSDFLTTHHSVLVVLALDSKSAQSEAIKKYFSPQAIEQVMRDSVAYFIYKKDEFAKGQNLFFICGKNDKQIAKSLKENRLKIREVFEASERKRVLALNLKGGKDEKLMEKYQNQHDFKIQIPLGYLEAQNHKKDDLGFILLRNLDPLGDRNLIISYRPYTSKAQFEPDSILAWRDWIGKTFIKDPEHGSYMESQADMLAPFYQEINRNGNYSREMRALWRLSSRTAGGPFISHTFVDEKRNRIFYVEGFVEAPQRLEKRELIRDVESLIWSLQPL